MPVQKYELLVSDFAKLYDTFEHRPLRAGILEKSVHSQLGLAFCECLLVRGWLRVGSFFSWAPGMARRPTNRV